MLSRAPSSRTPRRAPNLRAWRSCATVRCGAGPTTCRARWRESARGGNQLPGRRAERRREGAASEAVARRREIEIDQPETTTKGEASSSGKARHSRRLLLSPSPLPPRLGRGRAAGEEEKKSNKSQQNPPPCFLAAISREEGVGAAERQRPMWRRRRQWRAWPHRTRRRASSKIERDKT